MSRTNARGLYWTAPQQLAHAPSTGRCAPVTCTGRGRSPGPRRPVRQPARAHLGRSRPARARRRRAARVPGGRRHGDPARHGRRDPARRGPRAHRPVRSVTGVTAAKRPPPLWLGPRALLVSTRRFGAVHYPDHRPRIGREPSARGVTSARAIRPHDATTAPEGDCTSRRARVRRQRLVPRPAPPSPAMTSSTAAFADAPFEGAVNRSNGGIVRMSRSSRPRRRAHRPHRPRRAASGPPGFAGPDRPPRATSRSERATGRSGAELVSGCNTCR